VAKSPCETSFHGGVWQKSGASKNGSRRPPNVRYLLRPRNIRDSMATIVKVFSTSRRRDRAMHARVTMTRASASRGTMHPSFLGRALSLQDRGRRESRVLVAPAASRGNGKNHTSFSQPQVQPSKTRLSPRNGFTVSFVLSPVTGLFCHRRFADRSTKLDASVGASRPHDFAVRNGMLRLCTPMRPSHPAPTFVTIAKRPSYRDRMCGVVEVICQRKQNFARRVNLSHPGMRSLHGITFGELARHYTRCA
jgi:hypothetical protein